jgi:N-acetylglucosamine-6-phosphate deacetylase
MSRGTIVGSVVGAAVGVWATVLVTEPADQAAWHVASYKQGKKDALQVKNTQGQLNWELEQTCVGLWAQGLPAEEKKK